MHPVIERRPEWRRQRGFALLVTLLLAVLAGATLYVSARHSPDQRQAERVLSQSTAIASARDALTAYAVAGGNGSPGAAPCPDLDGDGQLGEDIDGDGTNDGNIACQANQSVWLGRLPVATLDISTTESSFGSAMWYAVDGDFVDWSAVINPDTSADLKIEGDPLEYAVILIVAGDPVMHENGEIQSRPSDDHGDYLEGENDDGGADPLVFASCDTDNCNDRVFGVTKEDLLKLVRERVTGEVRIALNDFHDSPGNGYYPWASPNDDGDCESGEKTGYLAVDDPGDECGDDHLVPEGDGGDLPDWIVSNEWYRYIAYDVPDSCTPGFTGAASCDADASSLIELVESD